MHVRVVAVDDYFCGVEWIEGRRSQVGGVSPHENPLGGVWMLPRVKMEGYVRIWTKPNKNIDCVRNFTSLVKKLRICGFRNRIEVTVLEPQEWNYAQKSFS